MSDVVPVMVVAEGASEQRFVTEVLAPYFWSRGIYLQATQISKKGQKGGDVKFSRARRDVVNFLRQRPDIYVATFVDYYGVKEWPGLDEVRQLQNPSPDVIAEKLNVSAIVDVQRELVGVPVWRRYLPFVAVHEFEALLFSDVEILAEGLDVDGAIVEDVVAACGSPERINNGVETSPSNRILKWTNGRYGKTSQGIAIAARIGLEKMRRACPNFGAWLSRLESLPNR